MGGKEGKVVEGEGEEKRMKIYWYKGVETLMTSIKKKTCCKGQECGGKGGKTAGGRGKRVNI